MKKFILIMALVLIPALAHSAQRIELDSTTSTLTSGGEWTGAVKETLYYNWVSVIVFADQDSATDGLVIQQSGDSDCSSPNWDTETTYSYTANTKQGYMVQLIGKCVRVKYTNGGTGQGTFRLNTFLIPYGE